MTRSLSKKRRFDVFKRDAFTCQYCGNTPPAVVLEVDHVIPVCSGGGDDIDNLVTACFDCNRGKSGVGLTTIPQTIEQKIAITNEQEAQLQGLKKLQKKVRKRLERETNEVAEVLKSYFGDVQDQDFRRSVRLQFLPKLDVGTLIDNLHAACGKIPDSHRAIQYFYGTNWRMIKRLSLAD